MKLDRGIFFAHIRPLFGGRLTPSVVSGTNVVFDIWQERYTERMPIAQLAYCLATMKHETASTMQPIKEIGNAAYFKRMYDIEGARPAKARELGNIHPGDGAKFCGMGDVQSTGRGNAKRNTQKLRALGVIGADVDFEQTPEKMMEPRLAAIIMFEGMEAGWFTADTLDKEIDANIDGDEHADYLRARRIINGHDRAELIAGYADGFLKALRAATEG